MISVAIVEDDSVASDRLEEFIAQFSNERGIEFQVKVFKEAVTFLNNYKACYDVIFMDINMPHLNGIDATKQLNEIDPTKVLIFVTDMAQFALKGYEVNALDFIVKPVQYKSFCIKMLRALEFSKQNERKKVIINTKQRSIVLPINDIRYVEVFHHKVVYHMVDEDVISYDSLKNIEQNFLTSGFSRSSNSYLINLRFVTAVEGAFVKVGDEELAVSRGRKKQFLQDLAGFYGGLGGSSNV